MSPNVLVVDDDVEVGRFLGALLREEKGCRVTVANSGAEARAAYGSEPFDLALVDLRLPDANGIELLKELREARPECRAIVMTGYSTVRSAVEAVKLGAYDYVDKPFDELDSLEQTIDRALRASGRGEPAGSRAAAAWGLVVSESSPLRRVLDVAGKVAGKEITVLLQGPTGTGKECVARFIHAHSRRADRPFVSVNCGAFTETLLASELFGHEKGAYTGAAGQRRGIFELADGGTLFLDEIGEATPAIQVKLLKVLESREFMRVGGDRPVQVDVRIIAATNADLHQAMRNGTFRKDLFYRLDVVTLHLPPLRERPGDIEALMQHFVDRSLSPGDAGTVAFSPGARAALLRYDWPGNVRELSNVVAGMMALRDGSLLDEGVLPAKISRPGPARGPAAGAGPGLSPDDLDGAVRQLASHLFDRLSSGQDDGFTGTMATLKAVGDRVAQEVIRRALEKTNGDRTAAARLLKANPRMLRYRLHERGDRHRSRPARA